MNSYKCDMDHVCHTDYHGFWGFDEFIYTDFKSGPANDMTMYTWHKTIETC